MNNTYELAHHGVKGQKWGVRRTAAQLGNKASKSTSNKKNDLDERKRDDMRRASHNRRLLSEKEIRSRIERIKLEKQLKDLTNSEINRGRKIVSEVFESTGKTVLKGAALYSVKAIMTKEFNLKDAAGYLAPKPKK